MGVYQIYPVKGLAQLKRGQSHTATTPTNAHNLMMALSYLESVTGTFGGGGQGGIFLPMLGGQWSFVLNQWGNVMSFY